MLTCVALVHVRPNFGVGKLLRWIIAWLALIGLANDPTLGHGDTHAELVSTNMTPPSSLIETIYSIYNT